MSLARPYVRPSLNALAVPIFGEFLLGMTVAMAGLYLASHTSDAAAGSFGLTQQILESLFVVFRVLAIGMGIVVTRALGANDAETARRTAFLALGSSTWAGLAVGAWLLFGDQLTLQWLNAPEAIHDMAGTYMMWLAPAMVLEAYNLSMASVLRAHLFARDSLRIMVIMHSSHLLLAVLLMRGLGEWDGWGLTGYAIAMLLSRAIGLALHLLFWRQRMGLKPRRHNWWHVRPKAFVPVLKVGVPGAGLEFLYRIAFMVSLATTAKLGVAALATHSYTYQTLRFVLLISMSIGWACEIMVGRLSGGGQLREADAIVLKGVRSGLIASGGLALLAAISAPWFMQVFTRDPEIIQAARILLWMSVLLETGRVFNLVLNGALRASGDIHFPLAINAGSIVLVLGLGSYLLGNWFGLVGVWAAYVADECLRGGLMWRRWSRKEWVGAARGLRGRKK